MSPFVYVLIFLATLVAIEGLRSFLQDRRRRTRISSRKRLRRLAANLHPEGRTPEDEASLLRAGDGRSITERLAALFPGREVLELRLYRAGLTITPGRFLMLSGALAVAGAFAGQVLFPARPGALGLAAIGLLPYIQAGRLAKKRAARFEALFPDALDLLIRSLKAGHSLSAGLHMAGEELPDPTGAEFALVADEVQLGQPLTVALEHMAHRIDSEDLPFFVTAIAIQQETGSNLAEVLENLATVIRERFKVYGKVRALTAMGRASANLLAGWPLIMVGALYMVNPEYVAPLWDTHEGHLMAMVSAIMVAIGYVVCRKMATIRV